jgi:hypothetical protein
MKSMSGNGDMLTVSCPFSFFPVCVFNEEKRDDKHSSRRMGSPILKAPGQTIGHDADVIREHAKKGQLNEQTFDFFNGAERESYALACSRHEGEHIKQALLSENTEGTEKGTRKSSALIFSRQPRRPLWQSIYRSC